jgi:hypothetical protein
MVMGKITIIDDCLDPARFIYMDYSGADPYGVVKKISSSLSGFFKVSSAGVSETDFKWDNTGDPISFYTSWWVQKPFSKYSRMWVTIKVLGEKGEHKNVGNFTLEMRAEIKTSFSFSTSLLKPIIWMYSYVFYNRRRRNYISMCKDFVYGFKDEISEHFNLGTRGGR